MTSTRGYKIISTKCCGAVFTTVRYSSINFSAMEFWTDGARTHSLMPTDGGLRECKCGNYFLLHHTLDVGYEEERSIPAALPVKDEALELVLQQNLSPEVELVVRRRYWRYLNDPYRDLYRAHRDKFNKSTKSFGMRLLALVGLWKDKTANLNFTVPTYELSEQQRTNLFRLLELTDQTGSDFWLEKAEIFRELSQFDQAEAALNHVTTDDTTTYQIIRQLIGERKNSPYRYRM